MASTVQVRPNGDVSESYTGLNGAGSRWQAMSDNSDGSWVQFFSPQNVPAYVISNLGTYAMAGNQRCAAVRGSVRMWSGAGSLAFTTYLRESGGAQTGSYSRTGEVPGTQTYTGDWVYSKPSGGEWTQAVLDALQLNQYDAGTGSSLPAIAEGYVDFLIQTQPTVSIVSPTTDQRLFSQQPSVTWTYNAQGDTVSRHRVKVFTNAVVTGGGFNPDSSSAVYDSGDVAGAATSKQCTTTLTYGGTYWFYVKLATSFNGADWWSSWAGVRFIINTPPVTSAVATNPATPITTTNTPAITFTYTDADGEASQYVQVRVFSEAQYSAGGFDPATSPATWDSGTVAQSIASGAAGSVTVGTGLSANTNFKAYVRAAEVGSGTRWGNYAASGVFIIQTAPGVLLDPPAVPAVTSATADDDNLRVVVQVEGRDNLLTRNQSTVDTGLTGLENDGNATMSRNATVFLQGGAALQMNSQAAGDMRVRTPAGTSGLPVVAGMVYTAMAWFKADSPTAKRNCRVDIRWYDAAGTYLSSDTTTGTAALNTDTSWTQVTATGTAPASAAYASLVLLVLSTVAAAEIHFADNLKLAPGRDVSWTRGGLVGNLGRLADTFNKADNAASLGNADQGGAWAVGQLGTGTPVWGITGNRAYVSGVGAGTNLHTYAVLTSALLADGAVQADITLSAVRACAGLVLHYSDGNNHLMARLLKATGGDAIQLYKNVAGTYTLLAEVNPAGLALGTTYQLRVEFHGGQVRVLLDGVVKISYLELTGEHNQFGAYAKYGLYMQYTTDATRDDRGSRWDNFVAELAPTQTMDLERSDDAGATWTPVRGATGVALPSQVLTVYDYEVQPGVLARYRAKVYAEEQGNALESAWSEYRPRSLRTTGASGLYASTPDAAALEVANLDVRLWAAMDTWAPATRQTFAMKYAAGGNNRSWRFVMTTTPRLEFGASPDGTSGALITQNADNATGYVPYSAHRLRLTWRGSDGRTQFMQGEDGVTWVQNGADKTVNIGSIFNGTAALEVPGGTNEPLAGNIYYFEHRNGIDGPVVASFDPSQMLPGDTTYTDPQGNVWSLNGGAQIVAGMGEMDRPLAVTGWWLKDPLDPTVNRRVQVVPPFRFRRKEPQATYEPLGRTTAVVVTDGPKGIEGELTLWSKDGAEYSALEGLLRSGHPLLLVNPFAEQWYIKVGEAHDWVHPRAQPLGDETTPIRHLRTVSVQFTEVAAPA